MSGTASGSGRKDSFLSGIVGMQELALSWIPVCVSQIVVGEMGYNNVYARRPKEGSGIARTTGRFCASILGELDVSYVYELQLGE